MKYQNLKNMTDEEKEAHKRKQKAKAQKKYYQTHKDYYKNYSTKWARQEKINLKKEIDRLNNVINELEKWIESKIDTVKYNSFDEVLNKLKELKEKK